MREHLVRAERTVEPYREQVGMAYRGHKGIERLSREETATFGECNRQHDWHTAATLRHSLLGRIKGSFGIERIKNSLQEQHIYPALHERTHLLGIGRDKRIEVEVAESRVIDTGRHGTGLSGRSYRPCHKTGLPGGRIVVGCTTRYLGCRTVYLPDMTFQPILRQRYGIGIERVCLYHIGTGRQICFVNLGYHLRGGKAQHIVTTSQLSFTVSKTIASEIFLFKGTALYHRTHSAIQYQHTAAQYIVELLFYGHSSFSSVKVS